ncbi:signal transduction diguanylate cyclase [Oleiphilus messinensis]|uniref:diguanylate cyclase n=2 Tax=Oleiphilus messinensis TaxID=141451 RepID=A0A1Y0IGJ7_9GAMM|nr:signal transduction diguanylate cyclase [Oleiphilus messinensis]
MQFPKVDLSDRIASTLSGFSVFVISVLCMLLSAPLSASPENERQPLSLDFDGLWSYSWGDLPVSETTGTWQFDHPHWTPIRFPDVIPDKGSHNIAWIRLQVPEGQWKNPYLFINSVDLTLQVFAAGRNVYQFGEITPEGESHFAGWPWHLVPVADVSGSGVMYFRVFSDYPFLGLSGEISLDDKSELLERVYARGLPGTFIAITVLLVGVISMILGMIKKDRGVALANGCLSIDLALMIFAENEFSQLVWLDPLTWRYIAAFTYFMIPVFLAWGIREWFKRSPPKVAAPMLVITLLFPVTVALLSVFSDFSFVNAYPYFDVFFIVSVLVLWAGCYARFRRVGSQGLLVLFGITALFVSLLLDMLSAHGLIDWIGKTGQWGLVFYTFASLAVYLVKDWKQQVMLHSLTHSLEHKVAERTRELNESKLQLEQLAREDYLTKILNRRAFMEAAALEVSNALRYQRPLTLVMFDVDHFKQINDDYGHAMGDDVLTELTRALKAECREGDLFGRYGGEEFVILLNSTETDQAENLVKRLHSVLSQLQFIEPSGGVLNITASFGVVSLPPLQKMPADSGLLLDQLLMQADEAMYSVKNGGRNGIQFREWVAVA